MNEEESWIRALDQRATRLRPRFAVSPIMPGDAVCGRAYDGLVAARAKRLMLGNKSFDDSEQPAWFWWARGGAALEKNWESGDFETWMTTACIAARTVSSSERVKYGVRVLS